jgi:hypothetical protein
MEARTSSEVDIAALVESTNGGFAQDVNRRSKHGTIPAMLYPGAARILLRAATVNAAVPLRRRPATMISSSDDAGH